jgi:ribosomal protein S18 acetylase RimI-like enzyme
MTRIIVSDDLDSLYQMTRAEIKFASEIVAKAFCEAGDYSKFSADMAKRMKYVAKIGEMAYRYSLKFGIVYATSENMEGVAAWLPHDKVNIPIWQYIWYGGLPIVIRIGKEARKELLFYDNLNKKKHKEHANFPHWYLYNIAVDPNHQGRGWASVLLNPMLAKADQDKLPCYLETAERNLSLYQHFGFEVIEHVHVPQYNNDGYVMMRYNK